MTATANPLALVTGGARRIGAEICRTLHRAGYDLLIHYRSSADEAQALADELNTQRSQSATLLQADLNDMRAVEQLATNLCNQQQTPSLLINNASSFYPTPLNGSTQQQWDDLINSNLRAAYFLTANLCDALKRNNGAVINIVDIHAQRGLPDYPIYSIAKAGLEMMTRTLAKELAPEARINGVSPGPILWPEAAAALSDEAQQKVLDKTLLERSGTPQDIADAVLFLAGANFVTGQVLAVDGGRSLHS